MVCPDQRSGGNQAPLDFGLFCTEFVMKIFGSSTVFGSIYVILLLHAVGKFQPKGFQDDRIGGLVGRKGKEECWLPLSINLALNVMVLALATWSLEIAGYSSRSRAFKWLSVEFRSSRLFEALMQPRHAALHDEACVGLAPSSRQYTL